jgi:hypothetical protein
MWTIASALALGHTVTVHLPQLMQTNCQTERKKQEKSCSRISPICRALKVHGRQGGTLLLDSASI